MQINLIITALATLTPSIVCADSGLITHPTTNHQYQRFDTPFTWREAQRFCHGNGAYLATITSSEENTYVFNQIGLIDQHIWLGGTDRDNEAEWGWITGETWHYSNWSNTQPDNHASGQDYLSFNNINDGQWDDLGLPSADVKTSFICEWGHIEEHIASTHVPPVEITPNLDIYVPYAIYNSPFSATSIWLNLEHTPTTDGQLHFIVRNFGTLE